MEHLTNHPFAFGVLIAFAASCLIYLIGGFFVVVLPGRLRCPRCRIRVASIKVEGGADLSPQSCRYNPGDMRCGVGIVCSACWEELKHWGFSASGNWAPGAIAEYLKNNPSSIGVFIALGALVVSIMVLLS